MLDASCLELCELSEIHLKVCTGTDTHSCTMQHPVNARDLLLQSGSVSAAGLLLWHTQSCLPPSLTLLLCFFCYCCFHLLKAGTALPLNAIQLQRCP